MNKKKFSVMNFGSISLLMIFIILCMLTLAALSLSSAASDENSSKKLADHNTKYYQACNQAEETLDIIDGILAESYVVSSDFTSYFSTVEERLSKLSTNITLSISSDNTSATVDYITSVNDAQSLEVELELTDPWTTSSGFYKITSWKEIQTSDWNADNTINLIQ